MKALAVVCVVGVMVGAFDRSDVSEEYEALEQELGVAQQQIEELTTSETSS